MQLLLINNQALLPKHIPAFCCHIFSALRNGTTVTSLLTTVRNRPGTAEG